MLKTFPDFRASRIGSASLLKDFEENDIKLIEAFSVYVSGTANTKKVNDIKGLIIQTRHIIEKPLDKLNLEDIREFLALLNHSKLKEWTKAGYKNVLKRFLRWHYKDWSSRFDNLRDLKFSTPSTQYRYTEDKMLSDSDIEKMLRKANTLKEKALLMVLAETGFRPIELAGLRWSSFKDNGNHGLLSVYSNKTKQKRNVPVIESVVHLRRWKQEYEYKDLKENDLIFPSSDRNKGLSKNAVNWIIKKIAKHAELDKNVYPYLLRHFRLTKFYELSEQYAKKLSGHTKDSRMAEVYSHTTENKAIAEALAKIYHVEEISKDTQHKLEKEVKELRESFERMSRFLGNAFPSFKSGKKSQ